MFKWKQRQLESLADSVRPLRAVVFFPSLVGLEKGRIGLHDGTLVNGKTKLSGPLVNFEPHPQNPARFVWVSQGKHLGYAGDLRVSGELARSNCNLGIDSLSSCRRQLRQRPKLHHPQANMKLTLPHPSSPPTHPPKKKRKLPKLQTPSRAPP